MIPPAAWSMSEDALQERIRKACKKLGLSVQHIHDSRRCWLPGWPDLAIFGTSPLFAELKSQRGTMSADQRQVRLAIEAAGLGYRLWKPSDWLDGTVANELVKLSPLPVATVSSVTINDTAHTSTCSCPDSEANRAMVHPFTD